MGDSELHGYSMIKCKLPLIKVSALKLEYLEVQLAGRPSARASCTCTRRANGCVIICSKFHSILGRKNQNSFQQRLDNEL